MFSSKGTTRGSAYIRILDNGSMTTIKANKTFLSSYVLIVLRFSAAKIGLLLSQCKFCEGKEYKKVQEGRKRTSDSPLSIVVWGTR